MTWILPPGERLASPNRYKHRKTHGLSGEPEVIVLHYAVDGDQSSDLHPELSENFTVRERSHDCMDVARGFGRRERQASAHFIIGRDGSKVQCVKLRDGAWGSGDGKLHPNVLGPVAERDKRPRIINLRTTHIEICNVGWAVEHFKIPENERVTSKHPAQAKSREWERYDDRALETLWYLIALVQQSTPHKYIMGHEDVTNRHTLGKVGGKTDPGPAFPWDLFPWRDIGLTRVRYDFEHKAWIEA